MECMKTQNRTAIAALASAGALWGLTVPLSKLSLGWLGPGWLTVARFALAAPVLAFAGRRGLRGALSLRVAGAGALGFGAVILLQNAGIEHTSVSHAAVLVGAVPVLVALISAGMGDAGAGPLAWGGYAVALCGVALVAGGSGSGATTLGDGLVLASAVLSAVFIVAQGRLLNGRDATAVTAVQFAAGTVVAIPFALLGQGIPHAPVSAVPLLAVAALTLVGTMLPFWLFAYGQARVPVQIAGAYVNLEPVVGAGLGWLAFGDVAGVGQVAGAAAVIVGILISTVSPDDAASWARRALERAPRRRAAIHGAPYMPGMYRAPKTQGVFRATRCDSAQFRQADRYGEHLARVRAALSGRADR